MGESLASGPLGPLWDHAAAGGKSWIIMAHPTGIEPVFPP